MAVFKDTIDVIDTSLKVEDKASTVGDRIGALLDNIFSFLLKVVSLLKTAISALRTIASFIQKAATALRNNPLAKGAWRVVFMIAVTILEGIGLVVQGLINALQALQRAAKGNLINKVEDAMLKVLLILGKFGTAAQSLRIKLSVLRKLCVILETQQKEIEKAHPNLRKTVNKNLLNPLKKLLAELDKLADAISEGIAKLDKELTKLKALEALLSGLTKLANALKNIIKTFLDKVNSLFNFIKALIYAIPFIEYMLDLLDSLIDWAIDKSGIRAILQRLANTASNLPFVKTLRKFAAQLKGILENILKEVEKLEKSIKDAIDKINAIKKKIEELIVEFKKLGLVKEKLEVSLPVDMETMSSSLIQAKQAFLSQDFESGSTCLSEFETTLWRTHLYLQNGPYGEFCRDIYVSYEQFVTFSSEQITGLFARGQDLEYAIAVCDAVLNESNHVTHQINNQLAASPDFTHAHQKALGKVLKELNEVDTVTTL